MFNAWSEIELFYQVRRTLKHLQDVSTEDPSVPRPPSVVGYRSKIKLDGTNAGIRVEPDGMVFAQSRSTDLTVERDNMGFAHWLFETPGLEDALIHSVVLKDIQTTIFGEWCGSGIQKGTAISKVSEKIFAVFAIQQHNTVIIEPDDITILLADLMARFPMIKVIDWYGSSIMLPYFDSDGIEKVAALIDQMVLDVEKCDPWVRNNFGIEGVGEGLVFYPVSEETGLFRVVPREKLDLLMFKAKGEKHRVKESKTPVQVDPEVFASIQAFAASFVTEARCEQAVTVVCGGEADMPKMGAFLKWIVSDVEKESGADLEASKLTFKQVSGAVQKTAREWFIAKTRC